MRRQDREATGIQEIAEILRQCKTCYLAVVDEGKPYVVPLSYGYRVFNSQEGNLTGSPLLELYFHSALEGRKLDIMKRNAQVCFAIAKEGEPVHADTPCNSGYYYSSVIGNGKAVFVEDCSEKCEALSVMFRQQTGSDVVFTDKEADTVCVFKIVSTDFTGKRKPAPKPYKSSR